MQHEKKEKLNPPNRLVFLRVVMHSVSVVIKYVIILALLVYNLELKLMNRLAYQYEDLHIY